MSALLNLNSIRAICFDIGDTLINVKQLMRESAYHGIGKLSQDGGVDVNPETFIDVFLEEDKKYTVLHTNHLFSNLQVVKMTFDAMGTPVTSPLIGSFLTYYRDSIRDFLVYNEKMHNFLSLLRKRGYLIGVISDGSTIEQLEILSRLGIIYLFDQITISEDVGCEKPDRCIFETCFSDLGVKPMEVLMVGDSYERDILGASNIGTRTMWIRNLLSDLNDYAPDIEASSIYDLLSMIPSINCE